MMKTVSAVMATLLLATTLTVASIGTADARKGRKAAAIIGGAALGILALEAMKADREYVDEGCQRDLSRRPLSLSCQGDDVRSGARAQRAIACG